MTMDALPAAVMTAVLQFVRMPERLKLAQCNTNIMHLITQECTALWTEIDLNEELAKHRESITDDMLAALLTRVNAREVTAILNVAGCHKIVGSGLEPMRGSQVLESLNLRSRSVKSREEDLDEALIVDILRGSFPYRLKEVRFPYRIGRAIHDQAGFLTNNLQDGVVVKARRARFYMDMQAAKYEQAIANETLCSTCDNPVCHPSRQIVPSRKGLPPIHCGECLGCFCRTATCPTAMTNCGHCKTVTLCSSCDDVRQCDKCKESFCQDCSYFLNDPCRLCKGIYCKTCDERCSSCTMDICRNCSEAQGVIFRMCVGHNNTLCSGTWTCEECADINTNECYLCHERYLVCHYCRERRSGPARPDFKCGACQRFVCPACINEGFEYSYFGCCGHFFCDGCTEVSVCEGCGGRCCEKCCDAFSLCRECGVHCCAVECRDRCLDCKLRSPV